MARFGCCGGGLRTRGGRRAGLGALDVGFDYAAVGAGSGDGAEIDALLLGYTAGEWGGEYAGVAVGFCGLRRERFRFNRPRLLGR